MASATLTNRSDSVACQDPFTYMGENFQIDYELAAFNARSRLHSRKIIAAPSPNWILACSAVPDGMHSNFQVGIMPTDSDAVSLLAADLNLALDGGADSHVQLGQTDLRYGRLNLYNNFGSELIFEKCTRSLTDNSVCEGRLCCKSPMLPLFFMETDGG